MVVTKIKVRAKEKLIRILGVNDDFVDRQLFLDSIFFSFSMNFSFELQKTKLFQMKWKSSGGYCLFRNNYIRIVSFSTRVSIFKICLE